MKPIKGFEKIKGVPITEGVGITEVKWYPELGYHAVSLNDSQQTVWVVDWGKESIHLCRTTNGQARIIGAYPLPLHLLHSSTGFITWLRLRHKDTAGHKK